MEQERQQSSFLSCSISDNFLEMWQTSFQSFQFNQSEKLGPAHTKVKTGTGYL